MTGFETTTTLAIASTLPAIFSARQIYSPASSNLTLENLNRKNII